MIFSLLDTPAYGGAEEYLLTVLFRLQESGHLVVLATNNPQVKEKCKGKLVAIDLPYRLDAIGNWKGLLKYFWSLPPAIVWIVQVIWRLQKENSNIQNPHSKTDVKIHGQEPVVCLFPGYTDRLSFSPIVKRLGCKLIWLEYGPLEPTFSRNYGFPKLLYAIGRSFPDVVVTISEWTKKSLVQIGHIPAEKIQLIYPGVNLPPRRDQKHKKDPFTVVTIARLAKEKEVDVLLRAWAGIKDPHARLIVIGDGPEKRNLEQLAYELDIFTHVEFTGFLSSQEKAIRLQSADLFIFPSAWALEGFGMTTIEAMAAGLPVITTGYGPQAEIVGDGHTGWYFRPHDSSDLRKKIQRAIDSPERTSIASRNRILAATKFSQRRMLRNWELLISSMVG